MTLLGAEQAVGSYSWQDFIDLDDDDRRELIDGELIEVEVPKRIHEHIVAQVIVFLGLWARERDSGRVLGSGYKVRITDKRGVMPDVQFYRKENRADLEQYDGLAKGRPDLVVEIASPSSRRYDRVKKLRWYAEIGVPEYWVIDPEERTVERLVLEGTEGSSGQYKIADALSEDEVFRPASFEGLEVPLRELWG
jgi:Uma2 family endonuclease